MSEENAEVAEVEAPEVEQDEQVEEQVEQVEDTHGHLNFDAYVEQGGDPDMYRGRKAFDQFKTVKDEMKSFKRSNNDLMNNVNAMMSQQKQALINQSKSQIAELQSQLESAHEEMDSKKAVKLTNDINKLEANNQQQAVPQQTGALSKAHLEEIADFQEDFPDINRDSESYNNALEKQVTLKIQEGYDSGLSDRAFRRLLKRSYNDVAKESKAAKVENKPRQAINSNSPTKRATNKSSSAIKVSQMEPMGQEIYQSFLDNNKPETAKHFLENYVVA